MQEGEGGPTSSSCMMMSAPMACWMEMLSSGVSIVGSPVKGEAKSAPCSVMVVNLLSETSWKPPESVRRLCGQFWNLCAPPGGCQLRVGGSAGGRTCCLEDGGAGAEVEVVGVVEDESETERGNLLRGESLDSTLGRNWHEGGQHGGSI